MLSIILFLFLFYFLVNNSTLLSTKEKENLLSIILVFLLSLSWRAILQLFFFVWSCDPVMFWFLRFFLAAFPTSKIQQKYSAKKFLAFSQNLTTFSRKKNYKKNLPHINTGFNFGQFSTFWIHHLLFGEILSPSFNLKNVVLDLYKLQTIFHEESGPDTLDFEGKNSISPDWWKDQFFSKLWYLL